MPPTYFATLIAILVTAGLSQSVTYSPQLLVNSIFNEIIIQNYKLSPISQAESKPPKPPYQGAPDGRTGSGTRQKYL